MKQMLCLLFASISAVFFISCNKEKNTTLTSPTNEGSILDRIVYMAAADGNNDTAFYIYDSQNRLSQIAHRNATNTSDEKETFEYDAQGRYTGYTDSYTDISGKLINYRADFSYDQSGKITKGIFTPVPATGSVTVIYTYAYNDNGDFIADTLHYQPGIVYSYNAYTYDNSGNLIRNDYYSRDSTTSTGYAFTYSTLIVSDGNTNAFHDIGKQLFLASNPDNVIYLTKGNVIKQSLPDGTFPDVYTYTYYSNKLPKTNQFRGAPNLVYFFK